MKRFVSFIFSITICNSWQKGWWQCITPISISFSTQFHSQIRSIFLLSMLLNFLPFLFMSLRFCAHLSLHWKVGSPFYEQKVSVYLSCVSKSIDEIQRHAMVVAEFYFHKYFNYIWIFFSYSSTLGPRGLPN